MGNIKKYCEKSLEIWVDLSKYCGGAKQKTIYPPTAPSSCFCHFQFVNHRFMLELLPNLIWKFSKGQFCDMLLPGGGEIWSDTK